MKLIRMCPRSARAGLWAAVAAVGLLVSACSGSGSASGANSPGQPSPSAGTVLDNPLDQAVRALPLTDAQGRQFTLGSLAGKTVVLTDFLTTCAEVCPMTSVNFRDAALAVQQAGMADSVVFVEVTVDPERDDPARLAAYQKLYGALPNWKLATAGAEGTATLWKTLGVDYQKTAGANPPPVDWLTGKPLTYDVTHQDVVFVIDPGGHERWITQGNPATGGQQPPSSLNKFLNDQGRANLSAPPQPSWTAQDLKAAITYVTGKRVG